MNVVVTRSEVLTLDLRAENRTIIFCPVEEGLNKKETTKKGPKRTQIYFLEN